MSAVVRKSSPVVVRPSRPVMTNDTIKLSSFDKGSERFSVTIFLAFENPIHEPANTTMRALSETLVHYYPFAGRIIVAGADAGGDDGELQILCNGEGVPFVSASSSCALKEALPLDHTPCERALLQELAISYPADGPAPGPADPLLLMQVTEFSCGGFVLGVTWNHAIADAAGMAQFVQATGELARGMSSPSVPPVRSDASLPCVAPSTAAALQAMPALDPMQLAVLDITVSRRSIHLVRAEFSSRFGCQPCTTFEAVTAILWRCRTRAIMADPETPAFISVPVNLRKRVGAKPGYYGNCAAGSTVGATSGAVADADVLDLAKMIRRAKENVPLASKMDQNQICSNVTTEDSRGHVSQLQQLGGIQFRYSVLAVTSWRHLGFENADFGSGKPARLTLYAKEEQHIPSCIACLPCQGEAGANVLTMCVKKEHAQAFLQELANFM